MCESPISPSISARGTSAATESTTTTSIAPLRTSASAISKRLLAGVRLRNVQVIHVHPARAAYLESSACSTSTNAATPPRRCAWAITC